MFRSTGEIEHSAHATSCHQHCTHNYSYALDRSQRGFQGQCAKDTRNSSANKEDLCGTRCGGSITSEKRPQKAASDDATVDACILSDCRNKFRWSVA